MHSRKATFQGILTALRDGAFDLPSVSLVDTQRALQTMIAAGENSDPDRRFEDHLLIEGSQNGCTGLVRHLLAAGIGPEVKRLTQILEFKGWTPLSLAAHQGHFSVVQALVSAGADIDRTVDRSVPVDPEVSANSALVAAASKGHARIVRFLLNEGASVDLPGSASGATALVMGASRGFLEVVQLLVEAGADIEAAKGQNCQTALFAASEKGHAPVVGYLLEKGARLDAANSSSVTPLMAACRENSLPVVDLLVRAGANLSALSSEGYTPLTMAAGSGSAEAVDYLLKKGALDPITGVRFPSC